MGLFGPHVRTAAPGTRFSVHFSPGAVSPGPGRPAPSATAAGRQAGRSQGQGPGPALSATACHLIAFLNAESRERTQEKTGIPAAPVALSAPSGIEIKGCHL